MANKGDLHAYSIYSNCKCQLMKPKIQRRRRYNPNRTFIHNDKWIDSVFSFSPSLSLPYTHSLFFIWTLNSIINQNCSVEVGVDVIWRTFRRNILYKAQACTECTMAVHFLTLETCYNLFNHFIVVFYSPSLVRRFWWIYLYSHHFPAPFYFHSHFFFIMENFLIACICQAWKNKMDYPVK